VETTGPTVHLAEVVDRKDTVIDTIRSGSYRAVANTAGLVFLNGAGRFVGGRRFEVDGTVVEADRIFLNTGTRDASPPIDGLDAVPYLTSRSLLELRELPEHLLVVGGGFIGCEFAQMFARFGARVTVVQRANRLIPLEEPEVSAAVAEGFAADGITVLTGVACVAVEGQAGEVRVGCDDGTRLQGTHLLVAAGRTPNSDRLGLEHLGIDPGLGGYLDVDDRLHTQAEGVWALGDLRGGAMFTHTARDDADVVYCSVFKGQDRSTAGRVVPHAVFCDPEVGSVGLTEAQAREAGYDVAVGSQAFAGVAKARAIDETIGLVKFVVDAATDRILGCHIAGPDAANLVHEAVVAMAAGASYGDLGAAIHAHPTMAEVVNAAAGGVHRPSA
jgi:pyruvate/2-oxoglutarate dehydrogenase complex dihydrolipoamide dehydrogenase (E3) component